MKKLLLGIGVAALAFTALMGYAHTPGGRPVLILMGQLMGRAKYCPLGYDKKQTMAERTSMRSAIAASRKQLPRRPALQIGGLSLGESSKTQTLAWFLQRGGKCNSLPNGFNFECEGLIAGDQKSTFWLEFDGQETLVGLRAIANFSREDIASSQFAATARAMSSRSTGKMGSGLLAQVSSSAAYRNYEAELRLTNMGDHFAVTENFLSY
jgi:hypothetical protein